MDDTIQKDSGPIDDVITENGFSVHGLMFNIKDVLQCLFLCSATMTEFYNNPLCNCFAITINTKDGWVMATPMTINSSFNETVIRNSAGVKSPQSEVQRRRNTYTRHDGNNILIILSKGYVMDNFTICESFHDFLMKEGEPQVMITAADIESLTLKNPYLE